MGRCLSIGDTQVPMTGCGQFAVPFLGRGGRETGQCSEKGEVESGPRLEKGRAGLQFSALAHTDWIQASEDEEEYCSSNQGDHWTTAKLLSLLITFIARFGRIL